MATGAAVAHSSGHGVSSSYSSGHGVSSSYNSGGGNNAVLVRDSQCLANAQASRIRPQVVGRDERLNIDPVPGGNVIERIACLHMVLVVTAGYRSGDWGSGSCSCRGRSSGSCVSGGSAVRVRDIQHLANLQAGGIGPQLLAEIRV